MNYEEKLIKREEAIFAIKKEDHTFRILDGYGSVFVCDPRAVT